MSSDSNTAEPPDLFQIMINGEAYGEPMSISDAHNYAIELKNDHPQYEYDVVERYNFFCMKCGDDFWTSCYDEYKKIRSVRWRCTPCVYSWL